MAAQIGEYSDHDGEAFLHPPMIDASTNMTGSQQADDCTGSHKALAGLHCAQTNTESTTEIATQPTLRPYKILGLHLDALIGLRSLSRRQATANFGTVLERVPTTNAEALNIAACDTF